MACLHNHSCEDHDCSSGWTLYEHIDLPKVSALNEAVPGSVKSVFKAWEQRLNSSGGHLESNEGDPELLVYIPFTSDVKIKSISVVGGVDGTSPSKMRAFINKEGIDFSDAQGMQAVQEWDLVENFQGTLEYQTRYSKFQNVASITLHFPNSFGGDTTKIEYIGFKGEATKLKRDVVATIVYELRPNPSDHKPDQEISSEATRTIKRAKRSVSSICIVNSQLIFCVNRESILLLCLRLLRRHRVFSLRIDKNYKDER
ncbi:PITH domain-containing protein 1 isoform X2 [Pyrus x bretschneideri]|uniref:PITH domain-containing protein 1 isoform X2 n=1 Tax=Pyrus x bretschneideri TaxID=225117 RepID=UPI00202DD6FB|nr:PITH domain-containing protein 1 isoform X2 [Pyrus x bretschneideri]